jgi:hypothetical protein
MKNTLCLKSTLPMGISTIKIPSIKDPRNPIAKVIYIFLLFKAKEGFLAKPAFTTKIEERNTSENVASMWYIDCSGKCNKIRIM